MFFIFMRIWPNNRLATPKWEILDEYSHKVITCILHFNAEFAENVLNT